MRRDCSRQKEEHVPFVMAGPRQDSPDVRLPKRSASGIFSEAVETLGGALSQDRT